MKPTNEGVKKEKALEAIPYPIMKEILTVIHSNPNTLITGKGRSNLNDNRIIQEEMIEKPQPLKNPFLSTITYS